MELHEEGILVAAAAIESRRATRTALSCPNRTINKKSNRNINIDKLNFKQIFLATITLSIIIILFNPSADQTNCVEGKKLNEKKILKSLVKGLIFKNLSTKKNFLPMPVPIPGKWQKILDTLLELNTDSSIHRKYSSVAAASAAADTSSKRRQTNLLIKVLSPKALSKIFHLPKSSGALASSAAAASASSNTLDNVKKYTRFAAAKYASKLISNQGPSMKVSSPTVTAAASFLGKPPKRIDDKFPKSILTQSMSHRKLFGYNTASASATSLVKKNINNNDLLVTLFNLVKLFQQLKELDSSKLINISKKSSRPSKSSLPIVSMNINNKKSFLNKMNYIHTLTTDFNHRHRHLNHGLSLFES